MLAELFELAMRNERIAEANNRKSQAVHALSKL